MWIFITFSFHKPSCFSSFLTLYPTEKTKNIWWELTPELFSAEHESRLSFYFPPVSGEQVSFLLYYYFWKLKQCIQCPSLWSQLQLYMRFSSEPSLPMWGSEGGWGEGGYACLDSHFPSSFPTLSLAHSSSLTFLHCRCCSDQSDLSPALFHHTIYWDPFCAMHSARCFGGHFILSTI